MTNTYHTFDNGLKIYDRHIIEAQRARYEENNVHEAEEESLFLEKLKSVRRKGIYINIGAAVGYYAILAKTKRADITVHAYEPLSMHYKYMNENMLLNGLKKHSIKIYPEAISTKTHLSRIKHHNYSSVLQTEKKTGSFIGKLKGLLSNRIVRTIPLDIAVDRVGGVVDLLQMDIQGHELEVLQAANRTLSLHAIKTFIVGTHSEWIHRECAKILSEAGYRLSTNCWNTQLQPDGILIGEV